MAGLAGCSGETSDGSGGDGNGGSNGSGNGNSGSNGSADENGGSTEGNESASEAELEEEAEEEAQEEAEETEGNAEEAEGAEGSLAVRIDYDGDWSGAVGTEESTRSVDGSGSEEIAIEGSPGVVSANAQKQDDSADELIIQILQDGEVVAEESTTAEYGVASVSESFF